MQATRNTRSENIRASATELPNTPLAAATTRSQNSGDGFKMTGATTRVSDHRSTLAGASRIASKLDVRIEVWVNEGSAGGEPDESTSRPRRGG